MQFVTKEMEATKGLWVVEHQDTFMIWVYGETLHWSGECEHVV